MQLRTWHVGSSLAVLLWSAAFAQPANPLPRVAVVVGEHAPQLDQFAASELCGYLEKLFQIHVQPATRVPGPVDAVFLIGNPQTNPAVKLATAYQPFPHVSDQGIVLRRAEYNQHPALIVGGGSPAATLWAVYELAERWGVRFLMEGDVIPATHGKFAVPDLNVEMEPVFRVRGHPTVQDFAASGESWGINDFRLLIAQLAKLKFNRLNLYAFGWQPYLDWECKGIKRRSAWLWYGYQYPIRPDMPGRSLFGNAYAFWSPDLPLNSSYHDLVTAGQRQFHQLIDYAHQHGMECAVTAPVTDFPPEFAPLVNGAVVSNQLGGLTVVPGPTTPLDDPGLRDVHGSMAPPFRLSPLSGNHQVQVVIHGVAKSLAARAGSKWIVEAEKSRLRLAPRPVATRALIRAAEPQPPALLIVSSRGTSSKTTSPASRYAISAASTIRGRFSALTTIRSKRTKTGSVKSRSSSDSGVENSKILPCW